MSKHRLAKASQPAQDAAAKSDFTAEGSPPAGRVATAQPVLPARTAATQGQEGKPPRKRASGARYP
jgi:hypothetical protein